ncbi:HEPN domain-containing protein [Sphingobacterium faecium]|uniref:HEPN domain-containing protein n=1 Tax=Sphingobacterium faecium TaxID=34087 RepID=UPI00320B94B6
MLRAKQIFDQSYSRVLGMHDLRNHLVNVQHFNSEFISDILRSEIVYIVSALDKFLHDVVKVGILEIFNLQRQETPAFNNFSISISQMNSIMNPLTNQNPNAILEEIVITNHRHLSFQDPDKIAQALSLIWLETHKWQKIAIKLGMTEMALKVELKNIVIRRNQIVHEGDIDLFSNDIQDINENDVLKSVNFINSLVNAIYDSII